MIDGLKKECIKVGSDARSKDEMLREIAALAKKSPLLRDVPEETVYQGLLGREDVHSTGLADGIAIPHCSFDSLKDFTVGLVVVPDGIDFNALDGKKSRFLFFIIGPTAHRNRHVKILSSISLLSKEPDRLKRLAGMDSVDAIFGELQGVEAPSRDMPEQSRERCQVTVYLQDEDLFNDILEILSSDTEGAVTVIETVNAGYYLNRLPLFSTFWSESDRTWGRILMSVIDKRLANDTIRRINMVRKEEGTGLLVTLQDLLYAEGSLNF